MRDDKSKFEAYVSGLLAKLVLGNSNQKGQVCSYEFETELSDILNTFYPFPYLKLLSLCYHAFLETNDGKMSLNNVKKFIQIDIFLIRIHFPEDINFVSGQLTGQFNVQSIFTNRERNLVRLQEYLCLFILII